MQKYGIQRHMFLTPFTPFFSISSINKDRYSGDFSFRLTKCSKSYDQQIEQPITPIIGNLLLPVAVEASLRRTATFLWKHYSITETQYSQKVWWGIKSVS